ncbi:MAG TPA: SH3 domain-containing protein [Spirochaetota bacterium]|nr:SH3 domain-containing protein [Spirochaetota bacterium]
MDKKILLLILCSIFMFAIACKKEGVSLINIGLRDVPADKKGSFKWIKDINRGQVVKILEEQADGEWMKVQLPDGVTEGWIQKTYIHKGKKQVIEFTDSSKLYDQPDTASKVKANLAAGSRAIVLKQKDQWYNVSVNYGVDGWVRAGSFKAGSDAGSQDRVEVYIGGIGKSSVEASKTLADSGGYTYTVTNLFDKNPGTTWQVGDGGVGEWVEITLPQPENISVAMINGFAKIDKKFSQFGADGDLYVLNNRVKSMKIEYWDNQNKRQGATVNFEDEIRDYQDAGVYQNVSRIRFIVDSVYKGQKWNDTALAEIKIEKQ